MVFILAMREVEAGDVHPGLDQVAEDMFVPTRGADSGDDFGAAFHGEIPIFLSSCFEMFSAYYVFRIALVIVQAKAR